MFIMTNLWYYNNEWKEKIGFEMGIENASKSRWDLS